MKNHAQLKKHFSQMQVIRPPKHRLSTFGSTQIEYCLITDVKGYPDRSRLRIGHVISERPAILTPDALRKQFQGFGKDGEKYAEWVISQYGNALRGLEYQFRNDFESSRIDLISPEKLTLKLAKDFDAKGEYHSAILRSTDKYWELSIMKFIIEETLASFSSNFQELQDRGFFEGDERLIERRHREVQTLLRRAKNDAAIIPALGKTLRAYGLFEQYQDDFFKLVQS